MTLSTCRAIASVTAGVTGSIMIMMIVASDMTVAREMITVVGRAKVRAARTTEGVAASVHWGGAVMAATFLDTEARAVWP